MKDMEQTVGSAGAEAQSRSKEVPKSAVSMKFKDYGQLERAYQSLRAEFTRKCQRLSELERAGRATTTPQPEQGQQNPLPASEPGSGSRRPSSVGQAAPKVGAGSESGSASLRDSAASELREQAFRNFLRSALQQEAFCKNSVHGRAIAAPSKRPDTFAEAGELFLKHLK